METWLQEALAHALANSPHLAVLLVLLWPLVRYGGHITRLVVVVEQLAAASIERRDVRESGVRERRPKTQPRN